MTTDELLPIPPIESATDPVHSASDLRQRWRALMGPLGFGQRVLWMGYLGPDQRLIKAISQLPVGPRPQHRLLRNVMSGLRSILDDMAPGTSVAMLLVGPGRGPVSSADRVWSKSLTEMAERFVVPLQPIFRANDDAVMQIATG